MFLLVSMLVCYHYIKKPLKAYSIVVYTVLLIVFLVGYAQYREFTAKEYNIKKAGFNLNLGVVTAYHHLLNEFDQFERVKDIIKYVPEKLNYQWGTTFFNLLLKPIPSRIWEGKPQGAGVIVTEYLYPRHHAAKLSIAPSIIGELYLNFHIIGVIAGMFLFGVFIKGLYCLLQENFGNRSFILFYAFILPEIFGEIRGDFAVVNFFLILNLIFLLFSLNYISIKRSNGNLPNN